MPISKIAGKLVYFAHVPKCAGTAVELYLAQVFGPLAFRDPNFNARPAHKRWTCSSPQHLTVETLSTLFPSNFLDFSFAVIRHPVSRILSAFRFQRDIEMSVAEDTTFEAWLTSVHLSKNDTPWQFDNHTRPMDDFVPTDARVFPLENGLDALVNWLRDISGPDNVLPDVITPRNVLDKRLAFERKPIRPVVPTEAEIALVEKLYAVDYERFKYVRKDRVAGIGRSRYSQRFL